VQAFCVTSFLNFTLQKPAGDRIATPAAINATASVIEIYQEPEPMNKKMKPGINRRRPWERF